MLGMYLGGQGQRPCVEDRYLMDMDVRLYDKPKSRKKSDVVRISLRQPVLFNRHTQVCTVCVHALLHRAVLWCSRQTTSDFLLRFNPVCCLCYAMLRFKYVFFVIVIPSLYERDCGSFSVRA